MTTSDGDTELVQLQQHVPFTMVENTIIQSLGDYVALGLYLDMRSRPPAWRINLANLARTKKQGRDSLTGAMNLLIEHGLVFRVKFQRPSGQWATRIYVAQRPVSLDELLAVRESYSGRCAIITSTALNAGANPRPNLCTNPPATSPPARIQMTSPAAAPVEEPLEQATLLVTPTVGKPTVGAPDVGQPTVGEPGNGQPDVGEPTIGKPAANYQEVTVHNPPPTPSSGHSPDAPSSPANEPTSLRSDAEEEGEEGENGRYESRPEENQSTRNGNNDDVMLHGEAGAEADTRVGDILDSLVEAWPQLGVRDLAKLAAPVSGALTAGLSTTELTEHLTCNTGGVRHPVSVLLARCENLPRPRTLPRQGPEWCGECQSPTHRWIEVGPDHRPVRCSRCNPQALNA